jgi:MYXO-CTERM domain-containing protein
LTKTIAYARRVRLSIRQSCFVKHVDGSHARIHPATRLLTGICRTKNGGIRAGIFWNACIGIVTWASLMPSVSVAEHEVDHRFVVEGFVCESDGRAVSDVEVMVKDTRVSVGKMGYTDSRGHYKVTLHLHNENQGDPILVTAKDQEQRITASFDPKDIRTERKATVNFGAGCVREGSDSWVYYSVGLGVAAVAAVAGATLMRRRRQPMKKGKGKR